ncbi:UDP-glucose--hexose-1-phosphate uridylyltransferase, partial [bacterium]|nr:UDP-glucose--hexose-1-phosphate uridylyltransferase [bacterium]
MHVFNPAEHPHRRKNILTGEWLLVAPHRAKRPWQGQTEDAQEEKRPTHDDGCYLCPGNIRVGGQQNPYYEHTFVFDNDFASLLPDIPNGETVEDDLLQARSERGRCRVMCFSPRHDLTLAELEPAAIRRVIDVWESEYQELGDDPAINHVQIFENKGAMMGSSNPHPHGQIWAQQSIPMEPAKELVQQTAYYQAHGQTLLSRYLEIELLRRERIVLENAHFVALVPFWAVWPFEMMIISKTPRANLSEMTLAEKDAYAHILQQTTARYDNLFNISFPYSAGLHQSPTDGTAHPEWHFHMHFYPPLLRSATVKKFMVG